jgi:hypothetical protein
VQIHLHKEALLNIADVLLIVAKQSQQKPKKEATVKKKGPVEIVNVVEDVKQDVTRIDHLLAEKKLMADQINVRNGKLSDFIQSSIH